MPALFRSRTYTHIYKQIFIHIRSIKCTLVATGAAAFRSRNDLLFCPAQQSAEVHYELSRGVHRIGYYSTPYDGTGPVS